MKEKEENVTNHKTNRTSPVKLGLILVLIGCGMADGMSKIYQELGTREFEELFLVCTFVIAFILSVLFVKYKKQKYTSNSFAISQFFITFETKLSNYNI